MKAPFAFPVCIPLVRVFSDGEIQIGIVSFIAGQLLLHYCSRTSAGELMAISERRSTLREILVEDGWILDPSYINY